MPVKINERDMNYEELLESRNGTAMAKEALPFGLLYKKTVDNKYVNVIDLREELKDSLVFCDAITSECERNMQLKRFAETHTFDRELLRLWEDQMTLHADDINRKRHQFLEEFLPIFQHYYEIVSGGTEKVNVVYQSRLDEKPLNELLDESLQQDRYSGYTNVGIHKDDLEFTLDGHPLKRFGSQGQQKSFVVSIRLAQFEFNYQK